MKNKIKEKLIEIENIHENNILRETIAPARVSDEIIKKAENIAKSKTVVI